MAPIAGREFVAGRRFLGRLAHGEDILAAIEGFCVRHAIQAGAFSLIGAVSSATIGAYDQKQQVYVTVKEDRELEILSCTGNISLKEGKPFAHAHIVLADQNGTPIGGHLFSPTIVFAGEIDMVELAGAPMERAYDETTGLMLWKMDAGTL